MEIQRSFTTNIVPTFPVPSSHPLTFSASDDGKATALAMAMAMAPCLGPHGRSKALVPAAHSSSSSALVVTKDGQQLLPPSTSCPLEAALGGLCRGVAERGGDGSARAWLLLDAVWRPLLALRHRTHRQEAPAKVAAAFDAVASAMEGHRQAITEYLQSTVDGDRTAVLALWSNVLLPGCTGAMTTALLHVLTRWLLPAPASASSFPTVAAQCRALLGDWDCCVFSSVSGLPLSESYVIGAGEAVIEGRCRDFSVLRSAQQAADGGRGGGWPFLVLKTVTTAGASAASSASSSGTVTVRVDRLADLALSGGHCSVPETYRRLIDILCGASGAAAATCICVCGEAVADEWIHHAALRGVVLVRPPALPSPYLAPTYPLPSPYLVPIYP